MIALLGLPFLAALVVWWAGRRDVARDPRLTTLALLSLLVLPGVLPWLPKVAVLPAPEVIFPDEKPAIPGWFLPALWAAGLTVCLIRLGWAAIGLARWYRHSRKIGNAADGVELRELSGLRGPVAAGVFHKAVFVPEKWNDLDEGTRHTVLLHELAHHRRRDPLIRWLVSIVCAVHWFNPLVHWMRRRLEVQAEQACDRKVLDAGVSAHHYAEILCQFASHRRLATVGMAMAEISSLETRVRHLMNPRHVRGFFAVTALGGVIILCGLGLAAIGRHTPSPQQPDQAEIQLRMTADPFPGDP